MIHTLIHTLIYKQFIIANPLIGQFLVGGLKLKNKKEHGENNKKSTQSVTQVQLEAMRWQHYPMYHHTAPKG